MAVVCTSSFSNMWFGTTLYPDSNVWGRVFVLMFAAFFSHGVVRRARFFLLEELSRSAAAPLPASSGDSAPKSACATARTAVEAALAAEESKLGAPTLRLVSNAKHSSGVAADDGGQTPVSVLPAATAAAALDASLPFRAIRTGVLDALSELLDELDSSDSSMVAQVGV